MPTAFPQQCPLNNLRKVRAAGYTGGYTMLRVYIKPKRALRPQGVVR